jgi:hypothetical protein
MKKLLPVVPTPQPRESALGYMLRLAEANYLKSPWLLFKLVKTCQQRITSPAFDPAVIANWTDIAEEDLQKLSYSNYKQGKLQYQFKGQKILSDHLNLRHPRICPQCIDETGFIDALWDIDLVTTCPRHERKLISRCPHCQKQLSWYRAGLAVCRCGANLAEERGELQPGKIVELHKKLERIAYANLPTIKDSDNTVKLGFLDGSPLSFFLNFILSVGSYDVFEKASAKGLTSENLSQFVASAALVVADWPRSFHNIMERLAKRNIRPGQQRNTALDNLHDFKQSLFGKYVSASKNNQIYLEFDRFITEHLDDYVDPRVRRNRKLKAGHPKWVSVYGAAKILNLDIRTLQRRIADGEIPHEIQTRIKRVDGVIFRTEDLRPELFAPTATLGERQAAAHLQLPVSALTGLRESGDYVQTYFGTDQTKYAIRDLDELSARIRSIATEETPTPKNTVSLAAAMRIKLKNPETKPSIIRAILHGKIRSFRPASEKLLNIRLSKSDLEIIVAELCTASPSCSANQSDQNIEDIADNVNVAMPIPVTTITELAATKQIGCDFQAIIGLRINGYLKVHSETGRRIFVRESVDEFSNRYRCLTELAKSMDTTTKRLTKLCSLASIPLIRVPRSHGPDARFISRTDCDYLAELAAQNPARTSDPIPHAKTAAYRKEQALRRYLENLSANEMLLPRRDGKPNLVAISKACGFSRDALYDHAGCKLLLEEFNLREIEKYKLRGKTDLSAELQKYIADLDQRGLPLPRRSSGRPNLAAIARACRLDRNRIYDDAKAMSLLKNLGR